MDVKELKEKIEEILALIQQGKITIDGQLPDTTIFKGQLKNLDEFLLKLSK